ncbi:MAG: hypothetical protein KDA96_06875 [Planctomycetaceae bacterium]|nr:hypothetical protein [Planctomycetaceae bacterium]
MSDIEERLSWLVLRAPGSDLDDRIAALAQSAAKQHVLTPQRSASAENTRTPSGATGRSLTISVAIAALIVGVLIGNTLPAARNSETITSGTASDRDDSNDFANVLTSDNDSPLASLPSADSATDSHWQKCLRFVAEFHPDDGQAIPSADVLRAVWEQHSGQTFVAESHIGDERFALCLACHRSGS